MAFSINTVFGAIDKFSGPLARMEAANKRFTQAAEKSFGGLGKKIINVRDHMVALAANISMAGVTMLGFNGIKDYESALTSFSSVSGVAGKDLEKLRAKTLLTAKETKMSAVDVVKSYELIGSAKSELLKDADALDKVTRASVTLSRASKDTLENSTMSVVGALNMFNLQADQSMRVVNALAAGEVVGAARTIQVTESIREFGAGAAMMNVSLEESISMVEVLSQKQIFGAEAGTKLRNVLSRISAAKGLPKEATDQMKKLGINMDVLSNSSLPFSQRLTEIAKAAKDPVAMVKIFGLENKEAASILLQNVDLFKKWTNEITDTKTAIEQAKNNTNTFIGKLEALKNTFVNYAISANESSGGLKVFNWFLDKITNNLGLILGIVGVSIGAYGGLWVVMKTGSIVTGAYNLALGVWYARQSSVPLTLSKSTIAINAHKIATKAIAAAQWLWTGAVKFYNIAMKPAIASTWAFTKALLGNPITWIVIGIIALIAGLYLLVKHWDKVKVAMSSFFATIWSFLRKTAKFIFDLLLTPTMLFLKLTAKVTGAQWAKDAISGINKLSDSIGGETKHTTNVAAAQTSVQNSRYEEIKKQQVDIQLTNKTDKNAVLKSNPAQMPKISTTN